MRRRPVGGEIVVVDARRQEFIDRKGHAPYARFPPIVADRLRQVAGGREGPRAVAQTCCVGDIGGVKSTEAARGNAAR